MTEEFCYDCVGYAAVKFDDLPIDSAKGSQAHSECIGLLAIQMQRHALGVYVSILLKAFSCNGWDMDPADKSLCLQDSEVNEGKIGALDLRMGGWLHWMLRVGIIYYIFMKRGAFYSQKNKRTNC